MFLNGGGGKSAPNVANLRRKNVEHFLEYHHSNRAPMDKPEVTLSHSGRTFRGSREWERDGAFMYCIPADCPAATQAVGFDVDSTLIVTKSGRKYAK